jgi:hypothetical protein
VVELLAFGETYCSRCVSTGNGLANAGDLVAGADNALARRVANGSNVLVLRLSTLPDLNLAAAAENTDSHGGEKVVGGVGVVVDTTVEDSSSVLANGSRDESLATGVVLDEVADIVDDTSDSDPGLALSLGLLNEFVPADDGEKLKGLAPVKSGALLVELLLGLLESALLDLVLGEGLEVVGKTHPLPEGDAPLGGVILPPLDRVTEIAGELVVEVVITLAKGNKGGDDVISRGVAVVERLVSEPVGQAVDTEGGLLDKADSENAGVDEATEEIAPPKAADQSGNNERHGDDRLQVVLVLPNDDGVLVEIRDVGAADSSGVLLHDHPSYVAVKQTLANGIGILVGVGVPMVGSVTAGPPTGAALHSGGTTGGKENSKGKSSLVARVGPEAMVTGS